jgi:hypothetical protein
MSMWCAIYFAAMLAHPLGRLERNRRGFPSQAETAPEQHASERFLDLKRILSCSAKSRIEVKSEPHLQSMLDSNQVSLTSVPAIGLVGLGWVWLGLGGNSSLAGIGWALANWVRLSTGYF